jgi:predicted metal-dependent phosphoesterase TrpH
MKLDLHIHTRHSNDCNCDIHDVLETAEEIGLDAIAITDHNNMAAVEQAVEFTGRIKIIPAMEITARDGTHLIGLFIKREVRGYTVMDIIDDIHRQNGLVMIPHPFRPGSGLFYNRDRNHLYDGVTMSAIMTKIDLVEAVNYRCEVSDLIDTDRYLEFHRDIPRAAGSDAHRLDEIGRACVEFEDFESGDLSEIKAALLESERLLRYEVYTDSTVMPEAATRLKVENRSLVLKAKNLVRRTVIRPVQRAYRSSVNRVISKSRTKIGEKN